MASFEIQNRLGGEASELSGRINLIEKNFTSLKKASCYVRVEEIESMFEEPPSWRIIVFQKLSEITDYPIHTYEDTEGRFRESLKVVLRKVFLQSCQGTRSV